jgi:hypothetical protein
MKHSRYYLLATRMETKASSMAITTKTVNVRIAYCRVSPSLVTSTSNDSALTSERIAFSTGAARIWRSTRPTCSGPEVGQWNRVLAGALRASTGGLSPLPKPQQTGDRTRRRSRLFWECSLYSLRRSFSSAGVQACAGFTCAPPAVRGSPPWQAQGITYLADEGISQLGPLEDGIVDRASW